MSETLKIKGSELLGLKYKPLFPYFKDTENAFQVLHADYVTIDEGTGIVHTAPGFGEEDHSLCKEHKIPVVCPVNEKGEFTDDVQDI